MTRKDALFFARVAGYHNDTKAGTRILVESRISRKAYNQAFNSGASQRANGIPCFCTKCQETNEQP